MGERGWRSTCPGRGHRRLSDSPFPNCPPRALNPTATVAPFFSGDYTWSRPSVFTPPIPFGAIIKASGMLSSPISWSPTAAFVILVLLNSGWAYSDDYRHLRLVVAAPILLVVFTLARRPRGHRAKQPPAASSGSVATPNGPPVQDFWVGTKVGLPFSTTLHAEERTRSGAAPISS